MEGLRVLVAGAGVAGLAVARALQMQGCAVEMVERAPAWTAAGTGIYLPGNATRALQALGLGAALRERAVPIPSQRFCDAAGRLQCEIDLGAVWGEVGPSGQPRHRRTSDRLGAHGRQPPASRVPQARDR